MIRIYKHIITFSIVILIALTNSVARNTSNSDQTVPECKGCVLIEKWDKIAWGHRRISPDSTVYYTDLIIQQLRQSGDTSRIAKYYNYKGIGYHYKGDNYRSYHYYLRAYNTASVLNDSIQYAHSMNNLGRFFYSQGNYTRAYDYTSRALEIFERLNDLDGQAYSLKRIGEIYEAQLYLSKALTASKKALQIRLDHFNVNAQITAHIDLALIYLELDSLDQANRQLKLAEKKSLELNNKALIAESKMGLTDYFFKVANYNEAIRQINETKQIAVELSNLDLQLRAKLLLGKAFFFIGDLEKAKGEIESILNFTSISNQLELQREAYFYLARINAIQGNGMKAYEYQLQFNGLENQLNNIVEKRAIDSLLFLDEIEHRAKENELLLINKEKNQELIQSQKWLNNAMILFILLILIVLIFLYRHSKKVRISNELLKRHNAEILSQKEEINSILENREELEEELLKSNQKLESILSSGYVSIISTTDEGVISHFSKGAERLLGYSAKEMVGINTPAIFHDEGEVIERGKELSNQFGKEIAGFRVFVEVPELEGYESREWTYIKKDGSRFPVQLVVSVLNDARGKAIGYLGIATDISQQKQTEEQLRQIAIENEHYKDILENVEDLIYELDGKGKYSYVNPATCRLSGFSKEELLDMHYLDLIPERDKEKLRKFYGDQVASKTESTSNEFVVKNKAGIEIWMRQTTTMFFDEKGNLKRILAVAQNINEIHELKSKLDEQFELYKLVSENSQDLIALHDLDGKYKYVSPSVKNLLGYEQKDLIGKNPYDFIHKEDHIRLKEGPHRNIITGKTENSIEYRIRNKEGKYYWFEAYNSPVFNENNEVISFQTSSRDITQRKKIQSRILQSEANLKALIENTTDVIYAIDLDYRLLTYNNSFKKGFYFLYNSKLRKGQRVDEAYPDGKSKEKWLKIINSVKKGERIIAPMSYTGRDNKSYIYEYYYNPIFAEDEVIGVSIFGRDITEKFKQEEKVKRYQEGLRLINKLSSTTEINIDKLLNNSLEIVAKYLNLELGIISEIQGNNYIVKEFYTKQEGALTRGQIFDFKNTYCDLTYKQGEVVSISDMKNSEFSGHPCYQNFQLESYIGAIIHVDNKKFGTVNFSSASPRVEVFDELDEDFMVLFANWIGANLQRHKVNRKLLKAKEKAESASKAKADFLSVMSHEIRTPLNGILGLTNILLNEGPREDQQSHLNLLKFSGDNLLVIINDILDFNKIEAGKITLENVDFDLYSLLSSIRQTNEFKISEKHIELKLEYDQRLPRVFKGDSVRLGQIVNNLVSNAIKFTKKGFVKIVTQLIEEGESEVRFKVLIQDTGKGIDPKNHQKIFERFSQEEDSTTRLYGGTGLGLSISKKLLGLMGSDIQLKSELGKGSIFSFELTLSRGKEDLAKTTNQIDYKSLREFNLNVLIADDNDVNYIIASNYLKGWGVSCDHSTDGESAVKMTADNTYDMILMDLQMPNKNGYEASRAIRKFNKNIPIVALTASALEEIRLKAKKSGMIDFLTKPINPIELYNTIISNLNIQIEQNVQTDEPEKADHAEMFNTVLDNMSKGDVSFKNELAGLFIENLNELREKYSEAIKSTDVQMAKDIKHKTATALSILQLDDLVAKLKTGIHYMETETEFDTNGHISEVDVELDAIISGLEQVNVIEGAKST